MQLCDRDIDDADLQPLYEAFFDGAVSTVDGSGGATLGHYLNLDLPVGRDGQTVAEYVAAGRFPHSRDRTALLEHLHTYRDHK